MNLSTPSELEMKKVTGVRYLAGVSSTRTSKGVNGRAKEVFEQPPCVVPFIK